MTSTATAPYTAYVGLDWADRKHDFCLQQAGNNALEFGILEHTPEAIEQWARALHIRFGGPIAICLETTKGPLVNALLRYEYLVPFPCMQPRWPATARRSRPAVPRTIHPTPASRSIYCCAIQSGYNH